MSEKVLKWLIYIAGAICLYLFIAIRFLPLFNGLLKEPVVEHYWDKTKYGELYYFSMIKHFREKGLPPAQRKFEYSDKQTPVNQSDILTFGDSFFEFSRHKQFSERLADDFHKKVHYVNYDFPLDYLEEHHYTDTTPKLVIIERVERYIPVTYEKEHTWHKIEHENPSPVMKVLNYIKGKLFYESSEELYNVIIKRSYLTTDIYSFFTTLRFDLFGYISSLTPVYLVDDDNSWLFYHDQVDSTKTSFYYHHSKAEMDSICNHMADLAEKLKGRYNMDLVYLPLPAKYTVYHHLLNDDSYNNFLPRLYKGLAARGVHFVKVFDDFMNQDTLLFYHTDSHWTQKGIDIAYNKTIDYIESDSTLRKYLQ